MLATGGVTTTHAQRRENIELGNPDYGIRVYVEHTGSDMAGERFAHAVREELRRSAGYKLTMASENVGRVEIYLVTADASMGAGAASAASIVYTVAGPKTLPSLLSSTVMVIGSNRIRECAQDLVAELDQLMQ